MIRRHPTNAALRRWLDTESVEELPEVSAHVDRCSRCAAKIEALDDVVGEEPGIAAALISLLEPADGLAARIEHGVNDRLGSRQMALVLGDLFAAAVETSKLLLTEEDL